MGCPVVHFEITSPGAKELEGFYGEIFDWKIDSNNPMNYGMIDTNAGGTGINGGMGEPEGSPQMVTFYIGVDSIDPYLEQIKQHGGTVIMPRTVIPGAVVMALFADPKGNVIGMVENEMPPAE